MSKFKHKFMLKIRSNKQGFSLIELLVTISIIGILAAVAVPAYNTYKEDAKIGVLKTTTNVVAGALRTCLALNPVADCNTVTKIQVKHDDTKITIAPGSGNTSAAICYNIQSANGFGGKANGCVDNTPSASNDNDSQFCKWAGTTATSGSADCADGVCRIASTNTNECE